MIFLDDSLRFPSPHTASPEGLVALGGDYRPERLLLAYSQGIFPWPSEGTPPLWFSPDPRFVLPLSQVHLSRSLKKSVRGRRYKVRADTAFAQVMERCAASPRPGQAGTWIQPELMAGFIALHRLGFAHSIEAWDEHDQLVGGLYGLSLGRMFFGESMFAHAPDASKVAFASLLNVLRAWSFDMVDCQVHTEHLARFGATEWPRRDFLRAMQAALRHPTQRGPWTQAMQASQATQSAQGRA